VLAASLASLLVLLVLLVDSLLVLAVLVLAVLAVLVLLPASLASLLVDSLLVLNASILDTLCMVWRSMTKRYRKRMATNRPVISAAFDMQRRTLQKPNNFFSHPSIYQV
jgi:hypothetical protein